MDGGDRVTTFRVDFVQGKDRPRFTGQGRTYTTKKTRDAEKAIREAFVAAEIDAHGSCPEPDDPRESYSVYIETHRVLPKSRPKKTLLELDTYKPDADNIAKLVCDALNGVAYVDDSQVTDCNVTKYPRLRGLEQEYMQVTVLKNWNGGEHIG